MNLTRRSFFGVLGGAVAATAIAPSAIIYKSRSVGFTTATEAQLAAHVSSSGLLTPEIYAHEFLKLLKKNLVGLDISNG